jgi:hypothetical protein
MFLDILSVIVCVAYYQKFISEFAYKFLILCILAFTEQNNQVHFSHFGLRSVSADKPLTLWIWAPLDICLQCQPISLQNGIKISSSGSNFCWNPTVHRICPVVFTVLMRRLARNRRSFYCTMLLFCVASLWVKTKTMFSDKNPSSAPGLIDWWVNQSWQYSGTIL